MSQMGDSGRKKDAVKTTVDETTERTNPHNREEELSISLRRYWRWYPKTALDTPSAPNQLLEIFDEISQI